MNRLKNVVVISNKRDPFYNMTLGSYLMERYRRKKMENKIMFLSTSHDGVFIGSMQNCWKECNIQKMEEEGVPLIRRDTGGGACYVDKGNRLFSLIGRTENGNTKIEFPLVVNALKKLGMDAELQGRNDIIVQGKKVSGSAFHLSENIYKHHGTILVDVNKELLTKFLNPNKLKLQSKGISSIQSRIINLKEINKNITLQDIDNSLIESFQSKYSTDVEVLKDPLIDDISLFNSIYEKFKSNTYRYNSNPDFTHQLENKFSFGLLEILFTCKQNIISTCNIYSDTLVPDFVPLLQRSFTNLPYKLDSIKLLKSRFLEISKNTFNDEINEFCEWLYHNL